MSTAARLSQARAGALASIIGELTDGEITETLPYLRASRVLEVARSSVRGARVVARGMTTWPEWAEDALFDIWSSLVQVGDRSGIDSMVSSLPISTLLVCLGIGGRLVAWESLDSRGQTLTDEQWLRLVETAREYPAQLVGAARIRGESTRVGLALDSPELDELSLLAHLACITEVDAWLAGRLDASFEGLLSRFGRATHGMIDLPVVGVADAEAARVLAKSDHAGLRRIAARSASSDALVRAQLLADRDPSIDAALCLAPLNANELEQLVSRLRGRGSTPLEAECLLFQPEPLSTKDRLWLLRTGRAGLTKAWISGQSAQDPRRGEIELLLKSPGLALTDNLGYTANEMALLHWAKGTEWADALEEALYSVGAAS